MKELWKTKAYGQIRNHFPNSRKGLLSLLFLPNCWATGRMSPIPTYLKLKAAQSKGILFMSIPIYMRELMNIWENNCKCRQAGRVLLKKFWCKATTSSTENQDKRLEAYERFLIQHSNRPYRSSETIWGICTLKISHEFLENRLCAKAKKKKHV